MASNVAFTLAVLAALALMAGGVYLLVKGQDRKKGWLMIGVAVVTLFNVWSWSTLPGQL